VNCSEIWSVTSSVFIHSLFAFLPPFATTDTSSVLRFHRGHQPWETTNGANLAERLPAIRELFGSVNTSAFYRY
jgi:hypothetical protein